MVVVSINYSEKELSESYVQQLKSLTEVSTVHSKGFVGCGDALKYIFEFSVLILPVLCEWIKASYEAKSKITIECDGVKIQGLSEDLTVEMLQSLLKARNTIDEPETE